MEKWVTKFWLPFLLVALSVAVFMEFGSVKTFNLDSAGYEPGAVDPRKGQSSGAVRPTSRQVDSAGQSRLAIGERYASLEELVADQQAVGFLRTGYFGQYWPARVAEIATDNDAISFVRQNGTRHNYTKFDGYRMKMVRLRSGDQETIVVFRSQSKR